MASCPLRKEQDEYDDGNKEHERRDRAAQRKTAFRHGLVEEIANRRAERPCQDEGRPEQDDPACPRCKVKNCEDREGGAEDQCRARITKTPSTIAKIVGGPVAKSGSERLREGDRQPIECLGFWSGDRVHVDRAEGSVPGEQRNEHAGEEQYGSAGITDAKRAVAEIGKRRSARRRGDD